LLLLHFAAADIPLTARPPSSPNNNIGQARVHHQNSRRRGAFCLRSFAFSKHAFAAFSVTKINAGDDELKGLLGFINGDALIASR